LARNKFFVYKSSYIFSHNYIHVKNHSRDITIELRLPETLSHNLNLCL